jgi:hypothetical protein
MRALDNRSVYYYNRLMTNAIKYGNNQVSGAAAPCSDSWHYTHGDYRPFDEASPEVNSSCPTCDAIMMPGAAVSEAFYVERQELLATGGCVTSREGKHVCKRKASFEALSSGAYLCARHNR